MVAIENNPDSQTEKNEKNRKLHAFCEESEVKFDPINFYSAQLELFLQDLLEFEILKEID